MPDKKIKRPSKIEYYMNIAKEVAARSNCRMVNIGAIIVKEDQIIATGYVGAPRKTKDCLEYGECLRRAMGIPSGQRYELCRSVHAEQNAIINAARAGVSVLDGTLYIYGIRKYNVDIPQLIDAVPCFICKKMVINSGLKEVVCFMKDGLIKTFRISDWVYEWKKKDMTQDVIKYETNYKEKQKIK
ncbi:MAG: dCMP deaminase family protein [Candidatus Firestonebacteria bacterium]|nr:dCMP deaminase family protein [Candidatus Firestonebacteria bacterium]